MAAAFTGEGAASQGAFHESLNLAALWKLPVVFVIEDNEWAISVPREASTAISSNADRAAAYGIPGPPGASAADGARARVRVKGAHR